MTAEIAIVVSPRDWAERLHRFVADHGGARVRARILDGREALDEGFQVLVAEDLTSFLTPRLMAELRRRGKRVLGVYEPVEPWGRERLGELGVDDTIEATASPEQMLRAVDALAITARVDLDAELEELATRPPRGSTAAFDPPMGPGGSGDTDRGDGRPGGTVTVVGGPSGAPGASEIALGLAGAARRRGGRPVLVDADDVVPSIAQRLGLPLHPNLRTAIDVVEHWTGQLPDTLLRVPTAGIEVLCGLPNASDWSQLRPGEVVDVVEDLARIRTDVIVNVGHRIEELGGGGAGPARYGVARTVLAAAHTVVGVCAPTPTGLTRFLDWVADVRALTDRPVHVVLDRAPGSRFRLAELTEELRRTYAPPSLHAVPFDTRVLEAEWRGEPVPHGPFTKALDAVAASVLPAPRPAGQRRGRLRGVAVRR